MLKLLTLMKSGGEDREQTLKEQQTREPTARFARSMIHLSKIANNIAQSTRSVGTRF